MNARDIIRLAIECGIGDRDLIRDCDAVITDYGDHTAGVLSLADTLMAFQREESARLVEKFAEGADEQIVEKFALVAEKIRYG